MAELQPFRGLRYTAKAGEIQTLTCPPYDIISEEQRQAYLSRKSAITSIRLELPKGDDPYREAGSNAEPVAAARASSPQDTDALRIYIYEEEFTAYGAAPEG